MAFNNTVDANQQGVQYLSTAGVWTGLDAGVATRVLTSNGTGVAPSFQAAAGGGITTVGNVTSGSVAFDGTVGTILTSTTSGFALLAANNTGGVGGAVSLTGGATTNAGSAGGAATLQGGAGNTSGAGGLAKAQGGTAGATGAGGGATLQAANGGATSGDGGIVTILSGSGTAGSSDGGALNITAGNGVIATGGAAGTLTITAGSGGLNQGGGSVALVGGIGTTGGAGGAITVTGGTAGTTGAGGSVTVTASNGGSSSGTGGLISITAGNGTAGSSIGGSITLTAGNGVAATGGAAGTITFTGGSGGTNIAGGAVSIIGGNGNGSGVGAIAKAQGGVGGATGNGGQANLTAGNAGATSGTGGAVTITSGASPTSGTAGAINITGGASAGTDKNAPDTTITNPKGTGTGAVGKVFILADASGVASGTTAHTAVNRLIINGSVALTSGAAATIATLTLASNSGSGGHIIYTVQCDDGTQYLAASGQIAFSAINLAGTKSGNTSILGTEAQTVSVGTTIVNTFAVTSGGLVQITSTKTGLTPTTYKITYDLISNSQQAITVP